MGLIKEGDDLIGLTDIQGAEDHLGDMDFKVAGTDEGITALQMDIKITGVTTELLRSALAQAKEARLQILDVMAQTIAEPRAEINENAPSIEVVQIDKDQIGMVIGKGGETIRGLEEEFQVSIGISEDGTIQIYGVNKQAAKDCAEAVETMTKEIEVGEEFDGTVVKIAEFGAFVELKKGTDGLLHVSAMGPDRVENVEDIMKVGDTIGVKVREIDNTRGRISLVLIRDPEGKPVEERAPREGGGGGSGDRGDRPRGGGGDRGRSGGGGGGRSGGGDRGRSGGGGGGRSGGGSDRPRSSGGGGGGRSGGGERSGGGNREGGGERSGGAPRSGGGRERSERSGGEREGGRTESREGGRSEGGRSEGGNREGGRSEGGRDGGARSEGGGGNRNRNRNRGGGSGGGGGNREGGGERSGNAGGQQAAPAPRTETQGGGEERESGRRFRFRIGRGGDDE